MTSPAEQAAPNGPVGRDHTARWWFVAAVGIFLLGAGGALAVRGVLSDRYTVVSCNTVMALDALPPGDRLRAALENKRREHQGRSQLLPPTHYEEWCSVFDHWTGTITVRRSTRP